MASNRIVIVDDDSISLKVTKFVLEDEGFEVVALSRGTHAYDQVIGCEVAAVILDVWLPDINGFDLLKELKARRYYGPAIFLTGRTDIENLSMGFQVGCDDYIRKPFDVLELVARVRSVIRRFHHHDQQSLGTLLCVEDAELSIGELTYQSKVIEPVVLSPTEMQILECLMRNSRIVISRDRLIERVWGYDLEGDTNRVDVYIRRVRRKIEPDPEKPCYLHTVRGLGYVFRPPDPLLEEQEETEEATALLVAAG